MKRDELYYKNEEDLTEEEKEIMEDKRKLTYEETC